MNSEIKPLSGNSVSNNKPPLQDPKAIVKLKGKFKENPSVVTIDESTLSKHSLLIGGTGCGKTTLFFHFTEQIRRRMTNEDIMIIFDSKGDFYKKFGLPDDYVLGNSRQYRHNSVKWNIFKEVLADGYQEEDFLLNIQEISRSIFAKRLNNTSSNPFFPNAACELFAAIITSIVRENIHNPVLRQENFYNDKLHELIHTTSSETLVQILSAYPDLVTASVYIDGNSEQSQGVLSEMYSVVKNVLFGVFADHGAFSMREFVRKRGKKVLFVEYDMTIGSVLTPMYSLLFDLALKEALGRNKKQGNVYLMCDEFRLLPNLNHIDDGVNFGRSLGVKVIAGLQSISQLTEVYGENRSKNIIAGFSSIYAFRANDSVTRSFVTEFFGKNMILERYKNLELKIVQEKRIANTVEDWDINSLNPGEAIVGLPYQKPFRFQFDDYT